MTFALAVSRFATDSGIDLTIDWCSVAAIQKQRMHTVIYLKNGLTLDVNAISSEMNNDNYENLFIHWEQSIKKFC